jgi:hypothetical protein
MEAGAIAVEGGPNGTVAARKGDNPETNVVNSFGFAHEVLTSACSAPR